MRLAIHEMLVVRCRLLLAKYLFRLLHAQDGCVVHKVLLIVTS